jgi:signal transduction histidine kinase
VELGETLIGTLSESKDPGYAKAQGRFDRRRGRVMLAYVAFVYPAFFALDLVVYPSRAREFGMIRAGILAVALPAFFLSKNNASDAVTRRVAQAISILATGGVGLMCALTDGFASLYLVGMIICFLAITTIEIFRPLGLLIWLCLLSGLYCVLCLVLPVHVSRADGIAALSFATGATLFCVIAGMVLEAQRRELFAVNSQLAEQNAQLDRARRHQGEFLSTVSHELRSPVNSVLGFMELLEEREKGLHEKSRADIARVKTSATRLLTLINDLLDLSKAEAGRIEIEVAPFDLVPVVRDVVEAARALIVRKDVSVRAQIPDQLIVESDEFRVRQILTNLCSNAAKFTETGEIVVSLVCDPDLTIEVRDTGIGIPEEAHEAVFQAFRQAHRGSGVGGTGLGLSIVSHLVALLGGRMELESRVGEGSTFRIRFRDIVRRAAA